MKPRTLEDKQAEQSRLLTRYKATKRAEWAELCEVEPRLHALKSAIRRADDPRAMLRSLADSWVRRAPEQVRRAALSLVSKQEERARRAQGLDILDDPLPPHRNALMVAKELLAVR